MSETFPHLLREQQKQKHSLQDFPVEGNTTPSDDAASTATSAASTISSSVGTGRPSKQFMKSVSSIIWLLPLIFAAAWKGEIELVCALVLVGVASFFLNLSFASLLSVSIGYIVLRSIVSFEAIAMLLLVASIIGIVVFWYYRRQRELQHLENKKFQKFEQKNEDDRNEKKNNSDDDKSSMILPEQPSTDFSMSDAAAFHSSSSHNVFSNTSDRLGKGAFGSVEKVLWRNTRQVAIKRCAVPPEHPKFQTIRDSLFHECALHVKLNHSNIVQVIAVVMLPPKTDEEQLTAAENAIFDTAKHFDDDDEDDDDHDNHNNNNNNSKHRHRRHRRNKKYRAKKISNEVADRITIRDFSPEGLDKLSKEFPRSCPALVLEWMPCGSLHDHLTTYGPMKERGMLQYLLDISRGLAHLHSRDILMKDLKTANLLIDSNANIKICDFGLSEQSRLHVEDENVIVGTITYVGPESVVSRVWTSKSDVWALGCIVTEMLTGRFPWYREYYEAWNKASALQLDDDEDEELTVADIPKSINTSNNTNNDGATAMLNIRDPSSAAALAICDLLREADRRWSNFVATNRDRHPELLEQVPPPHCEEKEEQQQQHQDNNNNSYSSSSSTTATAYYWNHFLRPKFPTQALSPTTRHLLYRMLHPNPSFRPSASQIAKEVSTILLLMNSSSASSTTAVSSPTSQNLNHQNHQNPQQHRIKQLSIQRKIVPRACVDTSSNAAYIDISRPVTKSMSGKPIRNWHVYIQNPIAKPNLRFTIWSLVRCYDEDDDDDDRCTISATDSCLSDCTSLMFKLEAEQYLPANLEEGYHVIPASETLPLVKEGWFFGHCYSGHTGLIPFSDEDDASYQQGDDESIELELGCGFKKIDTDGNKRLVGTVFDNALGKTHVGETATIRQGLFTSSGCRAKPRFYSLYCQVDDIDDHDK